MKDELKEIFASQAGAILLISILRSLAERTENQIDDALVDAIERALAVYL